MENHLTAVIKPNRPASGHRNHHHRHHHHQHHQATMYSVSTKYALISHLQSIESTVLHSSKHTPDNDRSANDNSELKQRTFWFIQTAIMPSRQFQTYWCIHIFLTFYSIIQTQASCHAKISESQMEFQTSNAQSHPWKIHTLAPKFHINPQNLPKQNQVINARILKSNFN